MSGELDPWWVRAGCQDADPEIFTPAPSGTNKYTEARALCAACPVRLDCLDEALSLGPETNSYSDLGEWARPEGTDIGWGYAMFQAGLTPGELHQLKRMKVRAQG